MALNLQNAVPEPVIGNHHADSLPGTIAIVVTFKTTNTTAEEEVLSGLKGERSMTSANAA